MQALPQLPRQQMRQPARADKDEQVEMPLGEGAEILLQPVVARQNLLRVRSI